MNKGSVRFEDAQGLLYQIFWNGEHEAFCDERQDDGSIARHPINTIDVRSVHVVPVNRAQAARYFAWSLAYHLPQAHPDVSVHAYN